MKTRLERILWGALAVAVVVCLLESWPRAEVGSRLDQLPLNGPGLRGQDLPLTAAESTVFHETRVVKRLYQAGESRFVVLVVDGTGDRHALHDPLYCFRGAGWTATSESSVALPGGQARHVQLARGRQAAEVTYWFSDGAHRHASALTAWWQSVRCRLRLAPASAEPMLVLVQPVTGTAVDWQELRRYCPRLFAI